MIFSNSPRIVRPNAGFILPGSRFYDVEFPQGKVGASGEFKIIKHRQGFVLQETPWFDNIILDAGLNRWGSAAIISGAGIGTGTSTPNAGQVGLDTESHWTITTGAGHGTIVAAGVSPYNNSRTSVYRTTLGALNGNYSEVAVGWAAGSNKFSRALILDGGGSPTTIAVGVAEQLDIWYRLSVYPPLVDIGPTDVTISGVTYSVLGRASNVNAISGTAGWVTSTNVITGGPGDDGFNSVHTGAIGAITASPAGTGSVLSGNINPAYVNASLARTGSLVYGLNNGNIGGIASSRVMWTSCTFQYSFSPVIPKDNTKTLTLNYGFSWARRP